MNSSIITYVCKGVRIPLQGHPSSFIDFLMQKYCGISFKMFRMMKFIYIKKASFAKLLLSILVIRQRQLTLKVDTTSAK
jgi:hypothetical protein